MNYGAYEGLVVNLGTVTSNHRGRTSIITSRQVKTRLIAK